MDDFFLTADACIACLKELTDKLGDRKDDIIHEIERHDSLVEAVVRVCPMLEGMADADLVEYVKKLGAEKKPPVRIYGDEDNLDICSFLKMCDKFKTKNMQEQLVLFDQAFMPVDPSIFVRKRKIEIVFPDPATTT